MSFEKYPCWIDVDGPGHPQAPGRVLVNNEDEELEALTSGNGPADLNPPPDPGQKSLDELDRAALVDILVREGIPDDTSEDELREAIRHGRERKADKAREAAEHEKRQREIREAGGDHGDGLQTSMHPDGDDEPGKDAAGDAIAPDTANEADARTGADRAAPQPNSSPATDARSDEAKGKVAAPAPAADVTKAAATPPAQKKGASDKPGKVN